ncbi:MAG: hydantoinase/oxoprolinase family protein [Chloroflexota bacterium]
MALETDRPGRRVGVDTGGTFTDFVWVDGGRLGVHKQLSTPQDPSRAILTGLEASGGPATFESLVHGSTVATNALLERRGARTALVTTAGFRDVLAIGRQDRPQLYALVPVKPPPLVPRQWRFEVRERLSAQGDIVHPLALSELEAVVEEIRASDIESVAVCLLFSFLRPDHEQAIRRYLMERVAQDIDLQVSLSSDILPEYREYERTSTTVINAYVAPVMGRYLRRLAEALRPRPISVMQSNGGVISAGVAATQAARTVLSGPAGGIVGARFIAGNAGYENIITLDMGGTSTDVALCPGALPVTSTGEIAQMPLRLPMLDIHTVGAGGGSLATVDRGGALHVGPQSAGADPGPIAYGLPRNGRNWQGNVWVDAERELYVTTTDANLVLGRLDADRFLGGSMRLNGDVAREALQALAQRIGAVSAQAAAWDVVRVANATMERAIRRISVERGFDPRDFALVAFGGAGPLHACELAHNLRIPRVLVPPAPGVLSALGMLVADPTRDYSQTVLRPLERDGLNSWLDEGFEPLLARAVAEMKGEGFGEQELRLFASLDLRYEGQSHELTVPYEMGSSAGVAEQFDGAHERRYGYRRQGAPVEVVNLRLSAVAPGTPLPLPRGEAPATADAGGALVEFKPVWFGGKERQTALYDRSRLQAGQQFEGPSIVFQYDSTTVVPPAWSVRVDEYENLLIERQGSTAEEE